MDGPVELRRELVRVSCVDVVDRRVRRVLHELEVAVDRQGTAIAKGEGHALPRREVPGGDDRVVEVRDVPSMGLGRGVRGDEDDRGGALRGPARELLLDDALRLRGLRVLGEGRRELDHVPGPPHLVAEDREREHE